ncbi:MAG: polysaccharide deacetylase family protein [Firmicutes bacterium]|nr:polysaccharide deacetylase family protein [Bacillota bacterium]
MAILRGAIKKVLAGATKLWGLTYDSNPILMYHSVHPKHPLAVTPQAFREQIAFFREKFRVVSLREYLQAKRENRLLPGTGAVTFDDGYRDNYSFAYPILREYSCPATIFICSGFLEAPDYRAFSRQAGLYPHLPPLTWGEVEEMQPLIELGAHTHSHVQISALKGDVLRRELGTNIAIIAQRTGTKPTILAYPWGQDDDFIRPGCGIVAEYFQGAVTTNFAARNDSGKVSPYGLRRLPVGPGDDRDFFAAKTTGALDFIGSLRKIYRRRGDVGERNTISQL